MLIYIHGFNSSSQSGKARDMAAWMADRGLADAFACPDLPHRPAAAIDLLEGLIGQSQGPAKLLGSSLGGFYATYLAEKHGLKAILVNPCVACHDKLKAYVGQTQKNWHSNQEDVFSAQHAAELDTLKVPAITRPERYLLLAETGDEVLDYRDAVAYYREAHQIILRGGDHGFTRFVDLLPFIDRF